MYVICSDDQSANILTSFSDVIESFTSSSHVHISTNQQPPQGCVIATVSAKCEIHLLLKVIMKMKIFDKLSKCRNITTTGRNNHFKIIGFGVKTLSILIRVTSVITIVDWRPMMLTFLHPERLTEHIINCRIPLSPTSWFL